jgi:hypothetical protein
MINIPYLRPEDEEKLVNFDFKQVRLNPLVKKERIMELRAVITREVFMHPALAKYIRRLVGATRPYNDETEWHHYSPSALVEKCVDLGASPRATICWGRLVKVWALLMHRRADVYPEDIQELARYVLPHRVWLGPHAASHGSQRGHGDRRRRQFGAGAVIGDRGAAVHAPRHGDEEALVNLQEIAEIELFIVRRMKEFTLGDHASVFKGAGFNFVGVRDWEPGDRMSSIDWSQSSLTNFSPDDHPRVRAGQQRRHRRGGRCLAVHPLRRRGRGDDRDGRSRERLPPQVCRRRSSRISSGS